MDSKKFIPIIDGHNDTIKKLFLNNESFLGTCLNVQIDLPKAHKAGMVCGFFAILTIAEVEKERAFGYGLTKGEDHWEVKYPTPLNQKYAESFTDELIEYFLDDIKKSNKIQVATNLIDIYNSIEENMLSVILHLEGADAISPDLSNLEKYYEKGLRSIGIVWSRANAFGYGVPFKFPASPDIGEGLTEHGKNLIKKCNELGIIVDLAHINEKGFWDVQKISKAPLVVSHSAVHSICSSSTNLTDKQIDAVRDSNGIIGIIFDVLNTRPDGKYIIETPLDVIFEHIDYIVNRVGIKHIAFGSDFDGGQMPSTLKDITGIHKLIKILYDHGYSVEDVNKIAYKNWLRVINDTW